MTENQPPRMDIGEPDTTGPQANGPQDNAPAPADPQPGGQQSGDQQPGGQQSGDQSGALTEAEQKKVRSAAMLAGALVSGAEPGIFDAIRESMAAGRALQSASPEIQQIMRAGGLPEMPQVSDRAQLEPAVLAELTSAKQLLAARSPQLAEEFRTFVLQSCHDVAEAAKGTSGAEQDVIGKVEQALA